MSDSIYDLVTDTVLRHATQPFTSKQYVAWQERVVQAYRMLGMDASFRLLLQDWVLQVLLKVDSDPGARSFVIQVIDTIHRLNRLAAEREER